MVRIFYCIKSSRLNLNSLLQSEPILKISSTIYNLWYWSLLLVFQNEKGMPIISIVIYCAKNIHRSSTFKQIEFSGEITITHFLRTKTFTSCSTNKQEQNLFVSCEKLKKNVDCIFILLDLLVCKFAYDNHWSIWTKNYVVKI